MDIRHVQGCKNGDRKYSINSLILCKFDAHLREKCQIRKKLHTVFSTIHFLIILFKLYWNYSDAISVHTSFNIAEAESDNF